MNKKYERYINYIVDDIKPPYFISMVDNYGLSEKEYPLVLSKIFKGPVTIKGNDVYDQNDKIIYYEDSDGYWTKKEYNDQGDEIYYEDSYGFWEKWEYDELGNITYTEDSNGVIEDRR